MTPQEIAKILYDAHEFNVTHEHELAAIWLTEPVKKNNGKNKARYEAGDFVKIEGKKYEDMDTRFITDHMEGEPFTHEILGCYGTLSSNKLSFMLLNLETGQPEIFKLK